MSTRELFGDSSSDDNDDDDDDEIVEKKEPTEEPKEATPANNEDKKESGGSDKKPKGALEDSDDDDSDKDDAQFDDADANIVGLAALNKPKEQSTQQKRLTEDDDFNEENEEEERAKEKEKEEEAPPPPTIMNWTIQDAPINEVKRQTLHMTKLPNLVGIQSQAFDPSTYSMEQEEEDFGGAVHNLMRWRYSNNTVDINGSSTLGNRESNTRLVEWEDGSWTLHIGSESFSIDALKTKTPDNFAGTNGFLYLSQKASKTAGKTTNDDDDEEHKDENEAVGTVLECMGPISSRLTIRPTSLQSDSHKALTLAVRQKTIKKARIAEFVTQADPEQIKAERIKVNSDLDKATQAQMGRKAGRSGGGGYRKPRMNRSYLEDEDDRDFDTTNLKAMKRRAYQDDDYEDDYDDVGVDRRGGGDDDEDDGVFHRLSRNRSERGRQKAVDKFDDDSSDDGDVAMGGGGDDEDEDEIVKKPANKKRPAQNALFDDDDDSD